ncbi:MAG TPA: PKD domain-containing protein [Thermoanaerobaculia bacterium]|nr:PKD domain-containing protein [Thermoanaerobaculia bacterium]
MKHAAGLLSLVLLLPSIGCDKATPVAPGGSILAISASPLRIGLRGSSTITILGRKPDGQPLNQGTEVRLTATLGSIDSIVTMDRNGEARATFRSDGRQGNAKITATTGSGSGGTSTGTGTDGTGSTSGPLQATVEVQVGDTAKSIVLQPTPTTIPEIGGTIQLLATVRDASGQPLPNQGVNFTTDVGRLSSRGAIVQTNGNGQARDTLNVAREDLAGNVSTISVGAQTAGTDGALISASFSVRVQGGRPDASFEFVRGATDLEVIFTNTSTGGTGSLTYSWNFGDGTSSNEQNPRKTYAAAGSYTVRLTVTDSSDQSDSATVQITVPVPP